MTDPNAPWWVNLLIVSGAMAASVTAILVALTRFTRGIDWLTSHARESFVSSISEVVDGLLAPIRDELRPTSGPSIKEALGHIEARLVAAEEAHRASGQVAREARIDLRRDLELHIEENARRFDHIDGEIVAVTKAIGERVTYEVARARFRESLARLEAIEARVEGHEQDHRDNAA